MNELVGQKNTFDSLIDLSRVCIGKDVLVIMKDISLDMHKISKKSCDAIYRVYKLNGESSVCVSLKGDLLSRLNKIDSERVDVPSSEQKQHLHPSNTPDLGTDLWNQLKRVSIPMFSGDKATFPSWHAAFTSCVDSAPISSEFKLLHMKQYLSGEPLNLIESLGHSSTAYMMAKEKLQRKYGGKKRELAIFLDKLDSFPQLKTGDPRSFEAFADLLDTAVMKLEEAGRIDELSNGTLFTSLQRKLTESLIIEYQRWLADTHKDRTVETLGEWALRESDFQIRATESVHGFNSSEKRQQLAFFTSENTLNP